MCTSTGITADFSSKAVGSELWLSWCAGELRTQGLIGEPDISFITTETEPLPINGEAGVEDKDRYYGSRRSLWILTMTASRTWWLATIRTQLPLHHKGDGTIDDQAHLDSR